VKFYDADEYPDCISLFSALAQLPFIVWEWFTGLFRKRQPSREAGENALRELQMHYRDIRRGK